MLKQIIEKWKNNRLKKEIEHYFTKHEEQVAIESIAKGLGIEVSEVSDFLLTLQYQKLVYTDINELKTRFKIFLKTKKGKSLSVTTKLLINNYQIGTWANLVVEKTKKQLSKLKTFIQSPQQRRKLSAIFSKENLKKVFSTTWKKKDVTGLVITQLLDVSIRTVEVNLNKFEEKGLAKVFDGDTKSLLILDFHAGKEIARVFTDDKGKKYHPDIERLVIDTPPGETNKKQHSALKYVILQMEKNNKTSEVLELYLTPEIIKKYKPELYESFLNTEVTLKLHDSTDIWESIIYNLMSITYAGHSISQQIMSFVSSSYETRVFTGTYSFTNIFKNSFFADSDTKPDYFKKFRNKIHKGEDYDQSEESLINTICQIFFKEDDFRIDNLISSNIPDVLATPFQTESLELSKDFQKRWEQSNVTERITWIKNWQKLLILIKEFLSFDGHIKISEKFVKDMEDAISRRVNLERDNGKILNVSDDDTKKLTYNNSTLKKFKFKHSDYQQLLHIWLFTLGFIFNNSNKELDKRNIKEVYKKILSIYQNEWLNFLSSNESLHSISDKVKSYNQRKDKDNNLVNQKPISALNVLMNVDWDLNVLTKLHCDFYTKYIKLSLDSRFIKNEKLAKIRDEYEEGYYDYFKKKVKTSFRITSDGVMFSWSETDGGHGDRDDRDTVRENIFWEYKIYNRDENLEKLYNKNPKLATLLSYCTVQKILKYSLKHTKEIRDIVGMGDELTDEQNRLYQHHLQLVNIKKNIEFDYEWLYGEVLSSHLEKCNEHKCSDYLLDAPQDYINQKEKKYNQLIESLEDGTYFTKIKETGCSATCNCNV